MIARFGASTEPLLLEQVAGAMFGKGAALGPTEDAIIPSRRVNLSFWHSKSILPLRLQVAKALVRKGNIYGALRRTTDEINVYDEVADRFSDASEPVLRLRVAMALVNKGVRLANIERWRPAVSALRKALPFEAEDNRRQQIESYIEEWTRRIKDENKKRYKYNKGMRKELPALPEGFTWPDEDFDKSPHFGKRNGIVRYLEDTWKPFIDLKLIDMPTLRDHYPVTAKAVDNHRRNIPPELLIPTIEEVNDRALCERMGSPEGRKSSRSSVAERRQKRRSPSLQIKNFGVFS